MNKTKLDAQDKRLLGVLTRDGHLSAGKIAEELNVTAPTIRTRMRNLIKAGVLKITGMVNPTHTRGLTVALVGITVQNHELLDAKLNEIAALDRVNWCAVVTGRYDILVEIVCSEDIGDLYDFLNKDISRIGGILSSESFVVMKSRRKWLYLPEAVASAFGRAEK
ncbi:Lrp/AsnC family transcriptional regulator [Pseudodesulfovibrio tunisiensis]|uniref:Lrp/AsnC family transcriptional regulator n=1 Tax=Pseudodesulfovibrio tunisiensis TaxID=463192 RepID=UPI001FB46541|nr:Lrp/AsnC family transcriptional regulator [Pseudodesulfovibrio tunisiensis]